jgi:hypothetical protein
MRDTFLAFSAEVTAFKPFVLEGTGLTDTYLQAVQDVVGQDTLGQLLGAYRELGCGTEAERRDQLRRQIFGHEKLGPVARNIVKLWYIGIWYQLPREWTDAYGARPKDVTFTPNATAYVEGLVWQAAGAHPPGAKAPGYGSWATPPRIPGLDVGTESAARRFPTKLL